MLARIELLSLEGLILMLASVILVCCIHDYLEIVNTVDTQRDMELVVACYGLIAFSLAMVVLFVVCFFARNMFRIEDLLLWIASFGMIIIVMYARVTFLLLFKPRANMNKDVEKITLVT